MKPRYRILWDKRLEDPDFWEVGTKNFYFIGYRYPNCVNDIYPDYYKILKQRVGLNN